MRRRPVVDLETRPMLPRHVRLQFDTVRGRTAVLSPEKVHWPDETSLAILGLCDGELTVGDIVARLASDYEAPAEEIEADVTGFIQEWSDRMLLAAR